MAKDLSMQFERPSEDIQEIIGIIPNRIIRWGITVALFLLLCVLLVSHYIRYPDVILAESELIADEQPYKVSWYQSEDNVVYTKKVKENQFINKGDTLLIEENLRSHEHHVTVSPFSGRVFVTKGYKDNSEKQTIWIAQQINGYSVILLLSINQSGKVKVGQRVQINLDEYPRSEFGYLEGKIMNIVPVKIEGFYRVSVELNQRLVTNIKYDIPDQPRFSGKAEILTNNRSVLQRIFHSQTK
ncbi:HlyD family secretion protein [Dyadobacter chenwenxiniae]|uniref:HlyD family secretion protein n=1 Tax=Dyadobacter chenwenxiniae TaxID=2906456 RepID=A0A9X1PQ70_9BACT|nr:HlyD family secretion protein [Dyadobacter chenwenxiniae]MCF0064399.1 HlyD family secretion protein [Dyadobacter chenwenxiniae]UON82395.1 HlyD family secretion protein [Dyadobacter chenwenxiniae]